MRVRLCEDAIVPHTMKFMNVGPRSRSLSLDELQQSGSDYIAPNPAASGSDMRGQSSAMYDRLHARVLQATTYDRRVHPSSSEQVLITPLSNPSLRGSRR